MSQKILHTRPDAANLLAISLRKLDQLIQDRTIAIVKIGKRTLIPYAELETFVQVNTSAKARKAVQHGR